MHLVEGSGERPGERERVSERKNGRVGVLGVGLVFGNIYKGSGKYVVGGWNRAFLPLTPIRGTTFSSFPSILPSFGY